MALENYGVASESHVSGSSAELPWLSGFRQLHGGFGELPLGLRELPSGSKEQPLGLRELQSRSIELP